MCFEKKAIITLIIYAWQRIYFPEIAGLEQQAQLPDRQTDLEPLKSKLNWLH